MESMRRIRARALAAALAGGVLVLTAACGRRSASSASPAPGPVAPPLAVDTTTPLKHPLPTVAARVNGQEIPTAQVVGAAELGLRSGAFQEKVAAYRQTLQQMVIRELLLQEALRRGLAAEAATVERAYDEARVGYRDDKAWAERLKGEGFTPASFREQLRAKHTVSVLLTQELQQVPEATDAELRAYYAKKPSVLARLRAAHVLVRVPLDAVAPERTSARLRAEQVRVLARQGQDFSALAKKWSDDSTTRDAGGMLEPFARGEMMKPVEDATLALAPGEISAVVETPYGFHVIKRLPDSDAEPPPFEEAKPRLAQDLALQRQAQRIQELVDRLRAKARIEIYL
jgi:parvulin-like peptidyl-prolyl isomerase